MKYLFAIKSLAVAGGAERVLCTIMNELSERNHEISVVTFDAENQPPFYPVTDRVVRYNLEIGDSQRPAQLLDTLKRMGALRALVTGLQPTMVVGFMHSVYVPLALAMMGTGVPLIGSEHTDREHYRSRRVQLLLIAAVTPLLKEITVLSESIRKGYPRRVRDKMTVIPNPVHNELKQRIGAREKHRKVLLNVGSLDSQKDQETLVRAFHRIAEEWPDWDLKIFGEGPLRGELTALVTRLGLNDRVRLPGITRDIESEYQDSDVFVSSSRYEAFGLVMVEAMSHALPVIGFSDCSGAVELIENGFNGYLVPPGNNRVEALSKTLPLLFGDEDLRERMGGCGAQKVLTMATTSGIADLWEVMLGRHAS